MKLFRWFKDVSLFLYIKYNYFSKNVVREKGVYIIPYKGAKIELMKGSKLYLSKSNLIIGSGKVKSSKAETYVKLWENSKWKCSGGNMVWGSMIEVKQKALLETGVFFENSRSVIVCAKHTTIGDDVWIGRDVVIYDSDHHQILDNEGNFVNHSKPVKIEDHVWLASCVKVLKGVKIGYGSVIAASTTVKENIPERSLVVSSGRQTVHRTDINWSSDRVPDWGDSED